MLDTGIEPFIPILCEFLQEVKYTIILLWHLKMLRHED